MLPAESRVKKGRPYGPAFQENPASYLAKRRIELGLTQADLGSKVGIDRSHVSRIERKEQPLANLPLELIINLADAIGCDMQELYVAMR